MYPTIYWSALCFIASKLEPYLHYRIIHDPVLYQYEPNHVNRKHSLIPQTPCPGIKFSLFPAVSRDYGCSSRHDQTPCTRGEPHMIQFKYVFLPAHSPFQAHSSPQKNFDPGPAPMPRMPRARVSKGNMLRSALVPRRAHALLASNAQCSINCHSCFCIINPAYALQGASSIPPLVSCPGRAVHISSSSKSR